MIWNSNRRDRHRTQIDKALRNGETRQSKSNTRVLFEGDAKRIQTFESSRMVASGRMSFYHWDVCVLAVDFDRDMITDFGYTGYSMSTNANVTSWLSQLRQLEFLGMRCFEPFVQPLNWTISDRYNRGSDASLNTTMSCSARLWAKFHMGASWIKHIDGDPWFHGPSYDADVKERGEQVFNEIFGDGVSWRWFTADWVDGVWTKHFIDKAAQDRWSAWRARREKAA